MLSQVFTGGAEKSHPIRKGIIVFIGSAQTIVIILRHQIKTVLKSVVRTGKYLLAIIATLVISFILWGMTTLNLFAKDVREQILKIRLQGDIRYEQLFDPVFSRYLGRVNLIAVETVQAGLLTELVYSIEFKRRVNVQTFMEELRKLNNNNKVALLTGHNEFDL